VVLNDDRIEPLAASQFQPPSGSCSASSPVDDAPDVLAEVGADRPDLPVDARLNLAGEEGVIVRFLRTASLPRHAVANEAHCSPRLAAGGIETHLPQERQDVHRGVPPAVPRRAAPPPVGRLESEQPRSCAFGRDPCTLGRNLASGRIGQVAHHLPGDRRVRIKQPLYDRSLRHRGLAFGWISRHLLVPPYLC
jgi:hypothetical protein